MSLNAQKRIFANEMITARYIYHKNKLTNWLLAATLFLSVFNASGYVGSYSAKQQQATQTELVIPNDLCKTFKRTASFKKAFVTKHFYTPIHGLHNRADALFAYNVLNKVKLDRLSMQPELCSPASRFMPVKTIPQSSDEDLFIAFIR